MTDTKAPERIWTQDPDGCGAVSFCDKQVNADDRKYIRADLYNELLRAADELADALREVSQCLSWEVLGECRGFSENLKSAPDCTQQARHALTAYQQTKEKTAND